MPPWLFDTVRFVIINHTAKVEPCPSGLIIFTEFRGTSDTQMRPGGLMNIRKVPAADFEV